MATDRVRRSSNLLVGTFAIGTRIDVVRRMYFWPLGLAPPQPSWLRRRVQFGWGGDVVVGSGLHSASDLPNDFLADLWVNHFRPIDGLCHPPHAIYYCIWRSYAAGVGHARC